VIWLSWRQLRAQAAVLTAAVLALVVVAALTGPRLADLARTSISVFDRLTATDTTLFYGGVVLMALAPVLVGVFLGAPLVARELETGTYRLAWSQSVTRSRWLASRLALTVGAAALATGAASLAVTWWSAPLDGAVSQTRGGLPGHLTPVTFAMRGIVPVGYAVFAVVLGAAMGTLLRRTLPAMAVTLALYAAVQIAVPLWVRPHLLPPVSSSIAVNQSTLDGLSLDGSGQNQLSVHTGNRGDWVLVNETVGQDGRPTALPAWFGDCLPVPSAPATGTQRAAAGSIDDCLARLTEAGYRQRVVYQPADRFWPLQWVETGLYIAASVALAAGCFWRVRRRLT
jgi:ABC-type transport system involved in multi-copper enzyme maturation permease subunit